MENTFTIDKWDIIRISKMSHELLKEMQRMFPEAFGMKVKYILLESTGDDTEVLKTVVKMREYIRLNPHNIFEEVTEVYGGGLSSHYKWKEITEEQANEFINNLK